MQRSRVEFGILTLLLGLAATGLAADRGAAVSGVIRDSKGVPQMGALVQIFSPDSAVRATTFTDLQGRYVVGKLVPGLYGIRASAALSVPVSREDLRLQPNRRAVVNLTLSGLFDEPAWLPAKARGAEEPRDDWSWTLRSSANRPILKLVDDDSSAGSPHRERRAAAPTRSSRASVMSPSRDFGEGATRVSIRAERVRANRSKVTFSTFAGRAKLPSAEAPVGVSAAIERQLGPAGMLGSRVAYESHPEIVRMSGGNGGKGLKVLSVSSAEKVGVGNFAEIEAGTRVQAVGGSASAVVARPFVHVSAYPRSRWTVAYSLATSRDGQDYDSVILRDADLPTASDVNGRTEARRGVHQEIALSRRTNTTLLALAFYADAMERISLAGHGDALGEGLSIEDAASRPSEILVDQSNGSFKAVGAGYRNSGVNLLITRALGSGTWIALQYCTGAAMAPTEAHRSAFAGGLPPLEVRRSQAATASVKASVARTGTRVRASYRWQPELLVTSIDPYDVLAGGDFLSLHLRQPLQLRGMLPEGMEMTVDGNNMLGQGRQRFAGRNGSPLYLASTPASLRAGIAFSF